MVDLGKTESVKTYCWGSAPTNIKVAKIDGFDTLTTDVPYSSLVAALFKSANCAYMPENKGIFLGSGVHTAKNNSPSLNGIG